MILSCQNLTKAFSEKVIIQNASFHLEDYDKAAIVGINGAGKSTLIKMIIGELPADDGLVTLSKGKTMGYLAQHQSVTSTNTIYDELLTTKQYLIDLENQIHADEEQMKHVTGTALEELMNAYTRRMHEFELQNGYAYRSEITGVLKGLGFTEDEFSKEIHTLSGGQKTRVALSKLLLGNPDLIILDEPTNHLDMNSIAWLETFLMNYKGAVLIVSHDRYFLDRITNKIIEIDQTKVTTFTGNYTDYAVKKEQLRISERNAYLNQQRELAHQEEVIEKLKSFNREKSIKRAESREKMLQKVQVLDKPTEARTDMKIHLEPHILSGNDVLTVENLKKSFDGETLFSELSFQIKRGEHVAIIGDNGTGKTTILKMINELLTPDTGKITLGSKVHVGYYDQEQQLLTMENTLFDEISDAYPGMTNTQIRTTLAAYLFREEDVFKKVSALSGGERGRMSLAKLMLSKSNFLILDEPTNHLDITSKEILEDAINNYDGTVLYVSHDRYFINRTATRILELSNQSLTNYLGNYDYYLEKKTELSALNAVKVTETTNTSLVSSVSADSAIAPSALDWKAQKEEQSRKRKQENDLKKCEEKIAQLETRDKAIDEEMALPDVCTNVGRLNELSKEKDAISTELESLYEEWEVLAN
ncbi:MAG: ABC-F family ATP-binding cassette domain-containing protein [Lachnospiraceae bacterium]|nr:ABC-F family ATP-binding cassette domain-containing protein [Lachnospiraceae bacterium]